jgi:hypothetical protein
MARPRDPRGAEARRPAIVERVVQLGRRKRASDAADQARAGRKRRLQDLEERVDRLEALLEGFQDAVHRESVRRDEQIGELEKKTGPREIARALSRSARERGI